MLSPSPLVQAVLFFTIVRGSICSCTDGNSTTDRLALLSFKAQISEDPLKALLSWDQNTHNFCQWRGVACTDREGQPRVTAINLDYLGLMGSISPSLTNLTFLENMRLHCNRLSGPIPRMLGSLRRLQYLNLSYNFLEGEIPPSIGNLSSLSTLDLSVNHLSGLLPQSLFNLSSLTLLNLQVNNLSGVLPDSIGYTLPHLQQLIISQNEFSSLIPTSLGALQNLSILEFHYNRLEAGNWEFLSTLTNCSNLQMLILSYNSLRGSIPSVIGNLSTKIERIELSDNQISGDIPKEIANLASLVAIVVNTNQLAGTIPPAIWELPRLQILSMGNNEISGSIPESLGRNANGSSLSLIYLPNNKLNSSIPQSIGNLTSLTILNLYDNSLTGSIPSSLANARGLISLLLVANSLSGPLPHQLWNLSSLSDFLVGLNDGITGAIPRDVGLTLPRLRNLNISKVRFYGTIPSSLSNATALETIGLHSNSLRGTIPRSLGHLQHLQVLLLGFNKLEANGPEDWGFLDALTNCTNLQRLDLGINKLSGVLPSSIVNLSTGIYQLTMGVNYISGQIPADISNLANLTWLDLGTNNLTGSIPDSIGRLKRLQILRLNTNQLSGEMPVSIGNLTVLNRLYLNLNNLSGRIPTGLRNCPLELLDLSANSFSGEIPKELFSISSLSGYLGLGANSFTGSLPPEVGLLKNLAQLSISFNNLTGTIPKALGECQILEELYMDNNFFNGSIPRSLQKLRGLSKLDLSHNNLSGTLPRFLADLPSMTDLNLSFNNFKGEVPSDGVFRDPAAFSVAGNSLLCSNRPALNLPPCSSTSPSTRRRSLTIVLVVVNSVLTLLWIIFAAYFTWRWRTRSRKDPEANTEFEGDQHEERPYSPKDYTETSYELLHNATNGFSDTNLIGAGRFGTVYIGVMDRDGVNPVAIKVLKLVEQGASKSFHTECAALRNIRHRNVIKVITSCCSIDPEGNDFRALVFEYMPNGSLDMWLHPQPGAPRNQRRLDLIQRLKIATDVASALNYLHHHAPTRIVHCDLKPGNVLLDNDMEAHLGDFGLATLLSEKSSASHRDPTITTGFRGSIGYTPPEYGLAHKASKLGDVYSYGILLLEMFTGKSPIDDTFTEGMSLSRYVEIAYPEQVLEITDPLLLLEYEDYQLNYDAADVEEMNESQNMDTATGLQECLASVFRVGICCTKASPSERMLMGEVTQELSAILFEFYESQVKNMGRAL